MARRGGQLTTDSSSLWFCFSPDSLLKLISYPGVKQLISASGLEKGHCSCKSSNLSCSKFCGCGFDGVRCGNSGFFTLDEEEEDDQRADLIVSGDESE